MLTACGRPWRSFAACSRRRGALLIAVHAGDGAQHFSDYKGIAVDITLHLRDPDAFAALVRSAGFTLQACEVRPPYPFEHATDRLYVAALGRLSERSRPRARRAVTSR